MKDKNRIIITGAIGIIAAVLVGVGEFLLHFDPLIRFDQDYEFLNGISVTRSTLGHYIGVLGSPLYLVGCWHIYLMLKPASRRWAGIALLVLAYGFVVGTVWIGSRATVSALINVALPQELALLLDLYRLRYENLLQIIRLAVLFFSLVYVWLVLTGKTYYPKWMAIFNPLLLIIMSFVVFFIAPEVGKYIMPIALNVAFFVFFLLSMTFAITKKS